MSGMKSGKRRRLERDGWRVGTAAAFLGLSPEEVTYLELKRSLGESIRRRRMAVGITQAVVARQVGSSQSRVAKIEAGDPSVSLDLQVRVLLALGADRKEVAKALAAPIRASA